MLGDGIAPVVEMLAAGVRVGLGSDGAASNHSQDLFETMKAASLLQKVKHQDAGRHRSLQRAAHGHGGRRPRAGAGVGLRHGGGRASAPT